MDYTVRFRVNKQTGQIEFFDVDYEGPQTLDDAEHNRRHEQLAAEIGSQIERDARVEEMRPGVDPDAEVEATPHTQTQSETEQERERETE